MMSYRWGSRITYGIFLVLSTWNLAAAQQKSLLWEITGNDLRQSSYLFGTIHLICPGEFMPGDSLMHALHSSKHLLLELDLTDPGLAAGLMSSMLMKDNQKLSDLLPESQYQKVAGFFKDSVHFDMGMLAGFKPFLLSSLLYNYILQCPMESVEGRLAELAKSAGLSITGLETADEQAAVFDRIPYQTQAEMVVQLIDSIHTAKSEFMELLDLYKQQDIEKLYEYTNTSRFGFEGFEDLLLADRNKKWILKIDGFIQNTPSFIAVGAAHLGGTDGLIELLRQKGYSLRPIREF